MFTETRDGDLRLSWDVSIYTLDSKHWWSLRMDAVSGEVLDTHDWVVACNFGDVNHLDHAHANKSKSSFEIFKQDNSILVDGSQYNVYELPIESPFHGDRSIVTEPANLNASQFGWHDTNASAGAEYTITRGNNVWAQEDSNGNNGTGYSPDGGATLNFDFPIDLDMSPTTYRDASLSNLFYVNNMMHDIWYEYGFDEVSGNFQANNYGNGGNAGDYVFADGLDGSGINNANFSTPPDGARPRMQMFLFDLNVIPHLLNINNGPLAGGVDALPPSTANGANGPGNITGPSIIPVTADLVLVDDGSAAPTEGCNPLVNGAALNGKIAVIKRGSCNFTAKIQNAQDAGAVGVIVVNHNNPAGDPTYTVFVSMYGVTDPLYTIPSIFTSYALGQPIIDALIGGQTINGTIELVDPIPVDGSLDNGIVAHEYGHGISNRLAGGPAQAGCLQNIEQMGEGWSDWFTMMVTMNPTDTPEMPRSFINYALSVPLGFHGTADRPVPYSTDFAVNNYTYEGTNDNSTTLFGFPLNEESHYRGFIWATALWDLTWAYIEKYGFDPDLYNGTGGNNKVMQLVIDGLKLQPCSPGMIDGRDALLAADTATGGEDQCMIWEVFANRGFGFNASQGSSNNINDQMSDFTMPPDTDPSLANCTSLGVDEFAIKDYRVYPNPTNSSLFIKTNRNYGEVMLTLTDINGRQVLSEKVNLFDTVEIDINTLQSGLYILNMKGQNVDINEKIIKN
jgi:hypothetical protein